MRKSDIPRCPHCNSYTGMVIIHHPQKKIIRKYQRRCSMCGVSGPALSGEKGADDAWDLLFPRTR